MVISFITTCFHIWLVSTKVFEIDGPDGPIFHWYPEPSNTSLLTTLHPTTHPSNRPTLLPTLLPTNKPTLPPTLHPTTHPTNRPTLPPTSKPTLLRTRKPTTFKPTRTPTNTPTTTAPTIAWDKKAKKQKKKKLKSADDSYLLNDKTDTIDLYQVHISDSGVDVLSKFDQYLVNTNKYKLLIVQSEHLLQIPSTYHHNIMSLNSASDFVFDHLTNYLYRIKDDQHKIDREWCFHFLLSSMRHLALLNSTVFDSIFDHLHSHQNNTAYLSSTQYYHMMRAQPMSKSIPVMHDIGQLHYSTVLYVLELFMHSFRVLFWHKFNDLKHTIYQTEYGKSNRFPVALRDADEWDLLEQTALAYMNDSLLTFIAYVRVTQCMHHHVSKHDRNYMNDIWNSLARFVDKFNYFKNRIDMGRVIYNWRYRHKTVNNHGVIGSSLWPVRGDTLEENILSALGYVNKTHKWNVNVKASSNKREPLKWIINGITNTVNTPWADHVTPKKGKKKKSNKLSKVQTNDKIKYLFIDPRYTVEYENKLVQESNDLLLVRAMEVNPSYLWTTDKRHFKVKSFYDHNDLLFDTVADALRMISGPSFECDYGDWLQEILGILSQYFSPSTFMNIFIRLDDMYVNKTTPQSTFMKYTLNRYQMSDYHLDQTHGIQKLTANKIHVHGTLFCDADVISMFLDLFELTFTSVFDIKMNAAQIVLKDSAYSQSDQFGFKMNRAQTMRSTFDKQLQLTVCSAKQWLVENVTDCISTNSNAKKMEQMIYEFNIWKNYLDIARSIYDWKYLDKLIDRDVALVMVEEDTRALDGALMAMGYRNETRIKRFRVAVKEYETNGASQMEFKIIPM
eukprot:872437_1